MERITPKDSCRFPRLIKEILRITASRIFYLVKKEMARNNWFVEISGEWIKISYFDSVNNFVIVEQKNRSISDPCPTMTGYNSIQKFIFTLSKLHLKIVVGESNSASTFNLSLFNMNFDLSYRFQDSHFQTWIFETIELSSIESSSV